MSLGRRLISTGGVAVCTTDTADVFGDLNGVALYNLDYDASDASGNYDGTPSNVTFGVGGITNYGARFNGSSSAIVVPNNILTTNDHSVSMWFNLDDTNGIQTVVEFDYENRILFRAVSTDSNKAYIGNSGYFNHGLSFSAGQWYHLVITFSAGNPFKIYIDGVLSYTGGNTNILAQNNDNIIGASNSSGANGVDGKIDQVRFFTKELNPTEVSTLYNNGDGETACVYTATTTDNYYPLADGSSDAVAYYKLDNSAEDSVSTNDGTESNIEYRFGRYGQAAVFNGTNSALDTNVTISGTADYSCSLWVNLEDDGTRVSLISLYTGFGASSTILYAPLSTASNPDEWYFSSKNTDVFYGPSIKFGQWQHVVLTYDHSITTFTIYIDKVSIGTSVASSATNQNLIIGAINASGANSAKGLIDQVRVYSTALTSDQVTELYNEKPETDTSTFKTVLYEANASTNFISNVGFQPDLVWTKSRDNAYNHLLYDSIRGAGNYLQTNTTIAQAPFNANTLSSFESTGFILGNVDNSNYLSGTSSVAWCLKAGGDDVLNEEGDIDSQVSANDKGFSIVKYTGSTSTSNLLDSVGHGLNIDGTATTPEMVIYKSTSGGGTPYFWEVWHKDLTNDNYYLVLNSTAAEVEHTDIPNRGDRTGQFTSTTFPITYTSANGVSGIDYIAYCFASVSGVSKIGSYEGDSTITRPITTNFRPSIVIIKNVDTATTRWLMYYRTGDSDSYYNYLFAEDSLIEQGGTSSTLKLAISDTGFTVPAVSSSWINNTNDTHLYMAFK